MSDENNVIKIEPIFEIKEYKLVRHVLGTEIHVKSNIDGWIAESFDFVADVDCEDYNSTLSDLIERKKKQCFMQVCKRIYDVEIKD